MRARNIQRVYRYLDRFLQCQQMVTVTHLDIGIVQTVQMIGMMLFLYNK